MSFTDNTTPGAFAVPPAPVLPDEALVARGTDNGSFKSRLAQRRRELEENTSFEMKVPGYENLWARYRVLGYDEVRTIGLEIEEETEDPATGERLTAAQTLATACEELLEFKGTGADGKRIFEALKYRWTAASARDLFEVDLPEGVAPREALLAIFPHPRDILLVSHFNDYVEEGMGYLPAIDQAISGESRAASAAT